MITPLLKQVQQYKTVSLLTPVFTALEVLMEVLIPFVTARIIDEGIEAGNIEKIYLYGGIMVGMAMLLRMPLYMILICFTLIASSMSVIIQRVYFKVTHGKRIFKMSPIHHHFELSGMTEVQIVAMYAVVVGMLSLIALFSLNVLP